MKTLSTIYATGAAGFFRVIILCLVFSCSNDDGENKPSDLMIGEWSFSSATMELTIDGKTLVQFLKDDADMSDAEAQAFAELLSTLIEEEFVPGDEVTIEMKSNGTYTITDPQSGDDSGKWELSGDGKTLTLDKGTADEMVFTVISITSSVLVIESQQEAEDDFDDDSLNETMHIRLEMTLHKK